MKRIEIITVVGARPQFIKAAALSNAFSDQLIFKEEILHTGQHYSKNMSEQFFVDLNIPKPFLNLGIGGGTHGQNIGRMIEKIEEALIKKNPKGVIVYGDTDSTLAAAISASKLKIPIFHIEAGLRSFNRYQPEEQNRILTDHLSDLCFAPTDESIINLKKEGIDDSRIIKTGDIMADTARIFGEMVKNKDTIFEKLDPDEEILLKFNFSKGIVSSSKSIYVPVQPPKEEIKEDSE